MIGRSILKQTPLRRANSGAKSFYRHNSTRTRATFKDLVRTPVVKSVFFTVIFGSVVVEFMRARKEYESLIATYDSKFFILRNIIDKLEKGESIEIGQELKMANTLTKHKYNTVTDIELDNQLDEFLKLADEEPKKEVKEEVKDGVIDTKKFI